MIEILNMLATWRLSELLVDEAGPFDIFHKLRRFVGVEYDEHSRKTASNNVAKLFLCILCMSVWCGAFFALLKTNRRANTILRDTMAYSAGAIITRIAVQRLKRG
jgi:hypothetical protein